MVKSVRYLYKSYTTWKYRYVSIVFPGVSFTLSNTFFPYALKKVKISRFSVIFSGAISHPILPEKFDSVENFLLKNVFWDIFWAIPLGKKTLKLSINTQVEHYFDNFYIATISI